MSEAIPAATSADILVDPDAAVTSNLAQAEALVSQQSYIAWGIGAAVVAAGIARTFAPGIWGTILDAAFKLLQSKKNRVAAEKAKRIATVGKIVVKEIEKYDGADHKLKALKSNIRDRIGVRTDLNRVIEEIK